VANFYQFHFDLTLILYYFNRGVFAHPLQQTSEIGVLIKLDAELTTVCWIES